MELLLSISFLVSYTITLTNSIIYVVIIISIRYVSHVLCTVPTKRVYLSKEKFIFIHLTLSRTNLNELYFLANIVLCL